MLVERERGDQVGLDKLPHSLSLVQCTTSRARGELASYRPTGSACPAWRCSVASRPLDGAIDRSLLELLLSTSTNVLATPFDSEN